MFTVKLMIATALLATTGGCRASNGGDPAANAPTAGPHFASLCLPEKEWPRLLATMKRFGIQHALEMHGGIETNTPDNRPLLNAYLAEGYSYYFGDNFDLWFTSDPFRKDVIGLGGVLKEQPITNDQQALANALLSAVGDFTTKASGSDDDPTCYLPQQ